MNNRINATVTGAVVGLAGAAQAAAQTRLQDTFFGGDDGAGDIASAGNGGVATASANGGAVSVGDVNSGGNAGNAIGVGDTWGGPVGADGGDCQHDGARHLGQRRHRHRGRLRRRLQPRLRQLAHHARQRES